MMLPVRAYVLQAAVDACMDSTGKHLLSQDEDGMLKCACACNTYVLVDKELFIKIRDWL